MKSTTRTQFQFGIILLLFALFMSAINECAAQREITINDYAGTGMSKENGVWYYNGEKKPFTGRITYTDRWKKALDSEHYYQNGCKNKVISYQKDSVKQSELNYNCKGDYHGDAIYYHKNGEVNSITKYINGKREGVQKFFDEQGSLMKEVHFKADNQIKEIIHKDT